MIVIITLVVILFIGIDRYFLRKERNLDELKIKVIELECDLAHKQILLDEYYLLNGKGNVKCKHRLERETYIRLGFAPLPHYTVADALLYQLGRKRHLSAGCVGTPNEMIWICQMNDEDPKKCDDLVCLHNFDYDGLMTEDRLKTLIEVLTAGGVDKSTESVGENGVLHSVSGSNYCKQCKEPIPDGFRFCSGECKQYYYR